MDTTTKASKASVAEKYLTGSFSSITLRLLHIATHLAASEHLDEGESMYCPQLSSYISPDKGNI